MIKKTSNLMTVGGVMAAFGTSLVGLPLIVIQAYAQVVKDGPPHWFNVSVLPMMLIGFVFTALGTALLGVAGKGADDHSTLPQIEASTARAVADGVVSQVDAKPGEPLPAVKVEIVNPEKDKP